MNKEEDDLSEVMKRIQSLEARLVVTTIALNRLVRLAPPNLAQELTDAIRSTQDYALSKPVTDQFLEVLLQQAQQIIGPQPGTEPRPPGQQDDDARH